MTDTPTAAHDEMFAALCDVVAVVLTGRTRLGLMSPRPANAALAGHEAVAAAIRDFDPEGAEQAMAAIMGEVRTALGRRMAPAPDRPDTSDS